MHFLVATITMELLSYSTLPGFTMTEQRILLRILDILKIMMSLSKTSVMRDLMFLKEIQEKIKEKKKNKKLLMFLKNKKKK